MKKKKSLSSKLWLIRNSKDQFVKHARLHNLRSRAWFKLHYIHLKYHLFFRNMNVIDLGASPGSWSKYAIQIVGKYGHVISCDINSMNPIPGVYFLKGNIMKKNKFNTLLKYVAKKSIHLVMSDMSPNITGISSIDIPQAFTLSKLAMKIAISTLCNGGTFLVKVFQGIGLQDFLNKLDSCFTFVKVCKPIASRNYSREIFVLARNFKT